MGISISAIKRFTYNNKILVVLGIASFFAELAYAILNFSALPMYVKFDLNQGSHLGLIISTFLLTEAVSRPFFGAIGDRIGRKPLLLLGPLITIFTAYFTIYFNSPWILVGMRAIDGIGCGAFWPTAYALTGDLTTDKNRSAAMSMLNVLYLGALSLGFLFGGMANKIAGNHEASFYLVSALMVMCLLISGIFMPKHIKHRESKINYDIYPDTIDTPSLDEPRSINLKTIWSSFKIVPDMLVFACVTFLAIGLLMPIVKLYCIEHLGLTEIQFGLAVLPLAALMGVFAVPLGRLGDKYGKCFAVCWGILACAVAMWLIAIFDNPFVTEFAAAIIWLGFVVTFPAWMALVSSTTETTRRGEVLGAIGMAQGLSAIIGAGVGAFIYSNEFFSFSRLGIVNYNFPFWVCAILLTVAVLIAFTWVLVKRRSRDSGTMLCKITSFQRNIVLLSIFVGMVAIALWVIFTYIRIQ